MRYCRILEHIHKDIDPPLEARTEASIDQVGVAVLTATERLDEMVDQDHGLFQFMDGHFSFHFPEHGIQIGQQVLTDDADPIVGLPEQHQEVLDDNLGLALLYEFGIEHYPVLIALHIVYFTDENGERLKVLAIA